MLAGKLDRQVTLRTRILTRNNQGEEVVSYTDLATVWGQKIDLIGREYFAAQQVNAEVTTRFRIRWRSDVGVLHRLVCGGVEYDILQASEIGRREVLELLTKAMLP